MKRNGSIVIVVLSIVTLVLMGITHAWRNALHGVDIAHKRLVTEKHFRAAHAILQSAIAFCCKNYAAILKEQSFTLTTSTWPENEKLSAQTIITPSKSTITLRVYLYQEKKLVSSLSGLLKQEANGSLAITIATLESDIF